MNIDSLWTIRYRGHYIHGHYDRDQKKEVIRFTDACGGFREASSLRAAKQRIGRIQSGFYSRQHERAGNRVASQASND
jgi:hypothetical protein